MSETTKRKVPRKIELLVEARPSHSPLRQETSVASHLQARMRLMIRQEPESMHQMVVTPLLRGKTENLEGILVDWVYQKAIPPV